jgi:SM-20-related protein
MVVTDEEIGALGEHGVFWRDRFLGPDQALAVRTELEALAARGALRPAGTGRDAHRDADVRGDEIAWLDREADSPALACLLDGFDALGHALSRDAWLGVRRAEVQVARYPAGGAHYQRHSDALAGTHALSPGRRVTAIYYPNPDWRPDAGGALRLHLTAGPTDLAPLADRLVVFLSERLEHEVLPTRAARWAVTAWYHGRP